VSQPAHTHAPPNQPLHTPAPPAKKGGWLKAILIGFLGLGGGAVATYVTAVVDRVAKPTKPVANFAVSSDGLTLTCQNRASGESGWWDFGDGSALEPFAPDAPVSHTYAKPGAYTVKLTVRNYIGDESERSVPVEVAAPSQASPPQIAEMKVQPVSPAAVAPATFRLTADVSNADSCVWDLGDGRLEVTEGGKIDRLVTFEKPGTFSVSLVAHNGKQGAKQTAPPVKVDAPRDGTTMVVLKVTDTGQRVERVTTTESVAVAVPADKGATTFSKTVTARPGYSIAEASPADAPASVKNVKVQVAADRRSATVSGDWAGDPKATNKAAGGSDAIVRVKLAQERGVAQQPTVTMVTGTFTGSGTTLRADLPLPPALVGVSGARREFQIEVRTIRDGKSQPILRAPATGTGAVALPWSTTQQVPGWTVTYSAKQEGETVVLTVVQAPK
jgi:PKD repeat protein